MDFCSISADVYRFLNGTTKKILNVRHDLSITEGRTNRSLRYGYPKWACVYSGDIDVSFGLVLNPGHIILSQNRLKIECISNWTSKIISPKNLNTPSTTYNPLYTIPHKGPWALPSKKMTWAQYHWAEIIKLSPISKPFTTVILSRVTFTKSYYIKAWSVLLSISDICFCPISTCCFAVQISPIILLEPHFAIPQEH